ncbi:kinase-like protein [Hesseltinella vesiculosa]|uniref:protein kinase C n=1 Tax=Hesseltinella vesiculosa TaxID=101127 RepID=A0A1X2GYK1_9FUNG|nr:kinase-like protein [Hesseltinella vesiculosa]
MSNSPRHSDSGNVTMNKEEKRRELSNRIQQEQRVLETARSMRNLLTDVNAGRQCDTEIKRAQRNIEYFEDELRKLDLPRSTQPSDKKVKRYTNLGKTCFFFCYLDLLMSEVPFNKPKVSLKLHELEYKLDVEKKLLHGMKTMGDAVDRLGTGGDRRLREIQSQKDECMEKLSLLNKALRKYKFLYIDEGEDAEEDYELETPPSARLPPGFRRPVTGKLQMEIRQARELTHIPTRIMKNPETTVVVKIDGNVAYRSRPARNDQWNETCEIHVNKASEVEVALYDQANDRSMQPIGMLWLRITDIADGLRKRKLQQDNGQGWATADDALRTSPRPPSASMLTSDPSSSPSSGDRPLPPLPLKNIQETNDGIEAWFDVEPVGDIFLRLNFVREAANRRPLDKLGRAGAVRQRPEMIHEMNGHQFVEKKFYNVMKCALCGDFLVNAGYQCEDCEYTCHKKCYIKVVTKCISKSDSSDPDEERLNHKIPHRFEPITNIGANWCCHCGYMLPLGSRSAKKCSECGITCHIKCAHLVPDFCGLSMEMANQMLSEIRAARRRTGDTQQRPPSGSGPSTPLYPTNATPSTATPITAPTTPSALQPPPPPPHMPTTPPAATPTLDMPSELAQLHINPSPYAPIPNPSLPAATPSPASTTTSAKPSGEARRVTLDDFSFLAVLGKGNFGKVMLAEDRHDKNLYAVKVLKKRFIIDNDEIESLRSEKRIFQAANRERLPFLIGLHSCFQTESRVYFVMEYVNGGDLMWHIQREPFSERRAKFYACEVLLALEYFHSLGIIYRDLKLDNIMLGTDGHIKLADYGLCKENMFYGNNTGTFCGTPEFMAPEILLEQRYGYAVDWWAFGVLIYEMLLGQSPFRGEDEDEIFDAILEDEILYPINMSRHSVSICQRLLTRDPGQRLGAGPNDANDIRAHPFFQGVSWEDMLAKRVPPPFYPTVNGRLDTSNFDEEFTSERPALTPIAEGLNRAEQQEFLQFSYVADWAEEASASS